MGDGLPGDSGEAVCFGLDAPYWPQGPWLANGRLVYPEMS